MRAMTLKHYGAKGGYFLTDLQTPEPKQGEVRINLRSNAIEAQDGMPAPPLVKVAAVTTDRNEIIVHVIDNDPGLEDTERIFDAFVTTKANSMGVGLAVSRSIAEAHDGRLWAENCPEGGARFNLVLPLSAIDGDPSVLAR